MTQDRQNRSGVFAASKLLGVLALIGIGLVVLVEAGFL